LIAKGAKARFPSTINQPLSINPANFSVKEKDGASLFRECGTGFAECLHSPFCRG